MSSQCGAPSEAAGLPHGSLSSGVAGFRQGLHDAEAFICSKP
ncbi:hypothetical protein [Streptomyces pseudoechinosporeus]